MHPLHALQYRMHPAIREFPSTNFYGGGLKDGPSVAQDTQRPWHASPAFHPLVFIDVKGTVSGWSRVAVAWRGYCLLGCGLASGSWPLAAGRRQRERGPQHWAGIRTSQVLPALPSL